MVCILLNNDDVPGLRFSRLLQNAGRKDIQLISAEELVYAPSFNCGFQNGKAFFSIQLSSGFLFSNETTSTVINRISYLPLQHVQRFKSEDRSYVEAELQATFTFLFSILPHQLFNTSTGLGLCGKNRSALEWLLLAKGAGFCTPAFLYQNNTLQKLDAPDHYQPETILFFQDECYGSAATKFDHAVVACKTLGRLADERILEISFFVNEGHSFFLGSTTKPTFTGIEADFIHALNALL